METDDHRQPDHITVHFHVIVPPSINFDVKTDRVYIDIFKESIEEKSVLLGNTYEHKQQNGIYHEYTVRESLPKRDMSNDAVTYQYRLVRNSLSKFKVKRKDVTEAVYGGKSPYRTLVIPSPLQKSIWSQFDGLFYKPKKETPIPGAARLKNWWCGRQEKDSEKAAQLFGQNLVTDLAHCKTPHRKLIDVRNKFSQLVFCLEKVYGIKSSDAKIKQKVYNAIWYVCEQSLEEMHTLTSNERKGNKLCCILLMLQMLRENRIQISEKSYLYICEQMTWYPDIEMKYLFEWNYISENFEDFRKEILVAVLDFISAGQTQNKEPRWMFLIPIVHLLSGSITKPFENVAHDVNHDTNVSVWWGLEEEKLKEVVKRFKSINGPWTAHWDIQQVSAKIQHLFEVDYLLPRTIIATLSQSELTEAIEMKVYPIYICCAAIIRELNNEANNTKNIELWLNLVNKQIGSGFTEETDENKTWLTAVISEHLVSKCISTARQDYISHSLEIFFKCISQYDSTTTDPSSEKRRDNMESIHNIGGKIIQWVNQQQLSVENDILMWNMYFEKSNSLTDSLKQTWDSEMKAAVRDKLKRHVDLGATSTLVLLYCKKASYKDEMKKMIGDAIDTRFLHTDNVDTEEWKESERNNLLQLVVSKFTEEYERISEKTQEMKMKDYLSWSSLPLIVNILFREGKIDSLKPEKCRSRLNCIKYKITAIADHLRSGKIQIQDLTLLRDNKDAFLALMKHTKQSHYEATQQALGVRLNELNQFIEYKEDLLHTKSLCKHLPKVETSSIDSLIEKEEGNPPLDHLVQVRPLVGVEANLQTDVVHLLIPKSIHELVQFTRKYGKSSLFWAWWKEECQKTENSDCTSLEHITECITSKIKLRLEDLSNDIISGEITFAKMDKLFGGGELNYTKMQRQMCQICDDTEVVEKRINVMKQFYRQENMSELSKVMLKFKKDFNLKGNFEVFENMTQFAVRDITIKSYESSFSRVAHLLEGITQEKITCLQTFVKCQKLVRWLRDSMKQSGLKDFMVFVDLAMISAGEDNDKIRMVQCLHAGVTGYSSLIFDFNDTDDCQTIIERCKIVWEGLNETPKIPDQLLYAKDHMYWFETIQKTHGEVEKSSFMKAKAINESGIFTIAVREKEDMHTRKGKITALSDVIKLNVPAENNFESKEYNFEQLEELQSQLMLVAAEAKEGKDSVERFTTVLDGVIRLSKVYIKLVTSGCVLFENFAIELFCEPHLETPVCVILQFKNGNDLTQLKCRKTNDEKLEDIMPKVSLQMETCLADWLRFIRKNRSQYEHLNFFTMDQIVILQQEIAKLSVDRDNINAYVFPLLQYVKHDCSKDDVLRAYDETLESIKSKDVGRREKEEHDEPSGSEDPLKKKFISNLVKSGYEDMVQLALEAFPNLDTSQAIFWCMEHKHESEKLKEARADKLKDSANITDEMAPGESEPTDELADWIDSLVDDESDYDRCELMLKKFNGKWAHFLQSVVSKLKDFISLEQLGVFLRILGKDDTSSVTRPMPEFYREAEPNLVICPTDTLLISTISIYNEREDMPLPKADEVLMCSNSTTLEQVDIFLRRAIFFPKKKIHCLVNADYLNYNVCEEVQNLLQDYTRSVNESVLYRLVIICGSENEHTSSLISSLEKYRRYCMTHDLGRVARFVTENLKEKTNRKDVAASVDFGRSTVRVVRSWRSGMGKTLYSQRRKEEFQKRLKPKKVYSICIPLHYKQINIDDVVSSLIEHTIHPELSEPRIFHIDITNEVQEGVDYLLFNLLILECLVSSNGYVWRKSQNDLYLVETMMKRKVLEETKEETFQSKHQILQLMPSVTCRSPSESLSCGDYLQEDQLFDDTFYNSDTFQKPYTILKKHIGANSTPNSKSDCLKILMKYCQKDPSWSELYHFVFFLYIQLVDFEQNTFLTNEEHFPGFKQFVLKFLIQMSKDFTSRALNMSEETEANTNLSTYQVKRTWEKSPHPYLFFNADHETFTFLGFNIDSNTRDLTDVQTQSILERNIMSSNLYAALKRNRVPLQDNFDKLPRSKKLERLCTVMGIDSNGDPDPTYELTTDNVKKIMAIYMRFRCDIPVIIMGETGCGKTRLVKFMCDLMLSDKKISNGERVQNMIIIKVHGGTRTKDIIFNVNRAENLAKTNGSDLITVLFFDEANTTESIGLIKEIMCDKTMEGKPLSIGSNLKIVAACNPYRRHPETVVQKLEKAGLGYHVKANETKDRLGPIPLRCLVYRVQPLPQSLIPYVWDFGRLTSETEMLYIRQMVQRYMDNQRLPSDNDLLEVISSILTECQDYMRSMEDECSFVSLRDVDRVLQVMSWFYSRSKISLFRAADEKLKALHSDQEENASLSRVTRSLILSLGVCYQACLTDRKRFRETIAKRFREPCSLTKGPDQIKEEIDCFQEAILDAVSLEKNIARNLALKENVFMMVICVELRIPLFLVGKPGSSKSLARLTVAGAMQGNASSNDIFKEFKQVQMLSYQCSPLSTPDGISTTFKQCAAFQEKNNLDKFVSVVVLEEIGLAEDSEKLPLKTLHPLLEDGCQTDEVPERHKKVGFVAISNWALDPAKMNRGIFVHRDVPDTTDLVETAKFGLIESVHGRYLNVQVAVYAPSTNHKCPCTGTMTAIRGICKSSMENQEMENLIEELSSGYLKVFQEATEKKREFYGLRDFYCMMKTINNFVEESGNIPTYHQLVFAILRNFSGLEMMSCVDVFVNEIKTIRSRHEPEDTDPDTSVKGLINACLGQKDSRHLLLLTENYSALTTFQEHFLGRKTDHKAVTIFGSSFNKDQEYTQVCRNINRIKNCMEAGNTVVMLNSENLYESLYEALNQDYVTYAGQSFVDLGLGTHRVKCPVHERFKLIVVAEKAKVYDSFPIPLINRLEKHCLTSKTLLSKEQLKLANTLKKWAESIANKTASVKFGETQKDVPPDKMFVGYHDDACSAITLNIWEKQYRKDEKEHNASVLNEAKRSLLWCATPDAMVRLWTSNLADKDELQNVYWKQQAHESILQYLEFCLKETKCKRLLAQVTTHARLLTNVHKRAISLASGIREEHILLMESLPNFHTGQQFNNKIREFLKTAGDFPVLLIIQCDTGNKNADLIACARYSAFDECEKAKTNRKHHIHILVIVQLPSFSGKDFQGIQCGLWHSAHIDQLYSTSVAMPNILDMQGKSIAALVREAANEINGDHGNITDYLKKRFLDLKQILPMCVQRAISMVRDRGDGGYQTTYRISLVLKILRNNDDCVKAIGLVLAQLLENKAKMSTPSFVENWLSTEAASSKTIQETGTLRRACLQTFERKLSPVLAGIISMLDTNQNIKIMEETDTWRQKLWRQILCKTELFTMPYKNVEIFNVSNQVDFVVHGTGFGGHVFECQMPFSWLIFQKMNDVLKTDSEMLRNDDCESDNRLAKVIEGIPIFRILNEIGDEYKDMAIDHYLHDFVHMVYTTSSMNSDEENNAIREMIRCLVSDVLTESSDNSLSSALMTVHCVHKKQENKLKYFREINHTLKECSKEIKIVDEDPSIAVKQIYDIVLKSLYLLVEHISDIDVDQESSRAKWLTEVRRVRYIVEQTFAFYMYEGTNDDVSKDVLEKARSKWNRIVTVQLFIETICKTTSEENITLDFCNPLWMLLSGERVDLKNLESVSNVEKFLKVCYSQAKKEYEQKTKRCSHCSKHLSEKGRKLPCKHEVCSICVQGILKSQEKRCPTCEHKLDEDRLIDEKSEYRDNQGHKCHEATKLEFIPGKDKLAEYQRRCNIFFMKIVSQLCFSENTAPSKEVVEKLMDYSLESVSTETGVAPNHAFRAFIFKLLIRSSDEIFKQQLDKHFSSQRHMRDQAKRTKEEEELLLLIVYCLEENISESGKTVDLSLFEKGSQNMHEENSILQQLEGLAIVRIFLTRAADSIQKQVKGVTSPKSAEKLISCAKDFCTNIEHNGPWKFVLKYLFHRYGMDTLTAALKSKQPALNWLYRKELDSKVDDRIDMYTLCGDEYLQVKDILNGQMLTKNDEEEFLKANGLHKDVACSLFQLAMYRETVLSKRKDRTKENLKSMADTSIFYGHTKIMTAIANNSLETFNLDISADENETNVRVKSLVFQWISVLYNIDRSTSCSLMLPLIYLAQTPSEYKEMFFPTMPEDDFAEIRKLLQSTGIYRRLGVYRCSKGHPYFIGDCGKPSVVSKCVCGAKIGGVRHELDKSNMEDDGLDRTETGYIIGKPSSKSVGTERNFAPAEFTCLRFILHLTLYAACAENKHKVVCSFMKQKSITPESVVDFFKSHIETDIKRIQRHLGCNNNEALAFCHCLLKYILHHSVADKRPLDKSTSSWNSKSNRRKWEEEFNSKYIKPMLQDSENVISRATDTLKEKNEFVTMLCDNSFKEMTAHDCLSNNDAFWMYRSPVNFLQMKKMFKKDVRENAKMYPILNNFIEKEHVLRAVRFIPNVLKLQRLLLRRFSLRYYKSEICDFNVGKVKQDKIAGEETNDLFSDTIEAWNIARHIIKDDCVYATKFGRVIVPRELCETPITDESPIEMLLPSTEDKGICSYAMVEVLMKIHNDFMRNFLKISQQSFPDMVLPEVSAKEITTAHLIHFDEMQDIQPLVLANCTFHIRFGAVVYDFENFEKQLVDRFIASKSEIVLSSYLQIDLMNYKADITDNVALMMLEDKIPQENILTVIRNQICEEMKDTPDVCQTLSSLDIAIRFLIVSDRKESALPSLYDFMTNTLEMSKGVLTAKLSNRYYLSHPRLKIFREMRQLSCKHVRSLWMTLSLQRAVLMITNGKPLKEIFEKVGNQYHETIPTEDRDLVSKFLKRQSNERMHNLLDIFFEFIVMRVATKQNEDDEDYIDDSTQKLKDCIIAYAESLPEAKEIGMGSFPETVLNKHCLCTWEMVVNQINSSKAI